MSLCQSINLHVVSSPAAVWHQSVVYLPVGKFRRKLLGAHIKRSVKLAGSVVFEHWVEENCGSFKVVLFLWLKSGNSIRPGIYTNQKVGITCLESLFMVQLCKGRQFLICRSGKDTRHPYPERCSSDVQLDNCVSGPRDKVRLWFVHLRTSPIVESMHNLKRSKEDVRGRDALLFPNWVVRLLLWGHTFATSSKIGSSLVWIFYLGEKVYGPATKSKV